MASHEAGADAELTVTMILADAAQVADGKLSILGGGVAIIPPRPQPMALGMVISVPYTRAGESFPWVCELLDADGMPVLANDVPVLVNGEVNASRADGWPERQPLNIPVVISFSALPVQPGASYVWRLAIDGASDERWALRFSVAPDIAAA